MVRKAIDIRHLQSSQAGKAMAGGGASARRASGKTSAKSGGKTGAKPLDDHAKALRQKAGRWLKVRREALGLTQADLADRLGIRYYSFISQIESGYGKLPSSQFGAWADALDVKPQHFAKVMLQYYDHHVYQLLFPDEPIDLDVRDEAG